MMPFLLRLATALGAAGLFLSFGTVEGASGLDVHVRKPASVSYQGRNPCPELCGVSGPDPGNWTVYHNLDQLARCQEMVFYRFSIHDTVDDDSTHHRIYACTSYGTANKPGVTAPAEETAVQALNNASFELARWGEQISQGADLLMLSRQMRQLLGGGYTTASNKSLVLFAQMAGSTAGLYMGKGVQMQSTANDALVAMEDALVASNNTGSSVAMQLCGDGYDGDHVFGFIATRNTSFTPVQQAVRSWANATCLPFNTTEKIISTASFTTPLVSASNATSLAGTARRAMPVRGSSIERRGDCTTIQAASGDSCASLAKKCGISASDFTKYNPSSTLCSTLAPLQHVCCSAGSMPDFTPKPNSDGSCATHTVKEDDTCSGIGAANSLTNDDIEGFNKNTWAWNGCALLYVGNIICISKGTPPMPASLANAQCGPQKPGTKPPSGGTANISSLNPCPLNACCDVWGQCGITADFCTDTSTGAPGTAKPGTNGCISNCGTDIVKGDAPSAPFSLAYYEGFGMSRPCLYQDVRQIDTNKFTHLHFGFGALSADYKVSIGDALATYEFNAFKGLSGVKRVLTFGGWAFSTDPDTYSIFRNGVTAANRQTMATNIATFIKDNDLDGVDIDWEYPGAPDIPGIPAGGDDDGDNFLEFLTVLKGMLPGKTVSIAAPASYWYLKAFPIDKISKVIDYIVFMTYDLHGQWDAGNAYSQEGCKTGMCLRSHVNLTETKTALAMITKAGVSSGKVVVGTSSYGRSFAMADPGCHGPDCHYTGTASQSNAAEGPCTGTAGYISDAEIYDIINNTNGTTDGNSKAARDTSSRINQNYVDPTSNSRIVVYDNKQWVAFMDPSILASREALYKGYGMGGTANWASDLESFNSPPDGSSSWDQFRQSVKLGTDPYSEGNRTGNWTDIDCSSEAVQNLRGLTPSQRWDMMDGSDAWSDVLSVWTGIDRAAGLSFTMSVSNTIHGPEQADCGSLLDTSNCVQTLQCDAFQGGGSGAASYEIWNSMVFIHEMYASYHDALYQAASSTLDPALKDFETNFAPIPKPPSDKWLEILLSCIDLVGTIAVSAFFNTILKNLPWWKANSITYDNLKDSGKAIVAFSTSIAGTLGKSGSSSTWTVEKQDTFSDYMGQVVTAWGNITEMSLKTIFDGSDSSDSLLTTLMGNGQMIEGSVGGSIAYPSVEADSSLSDLEASIAKSFFAFAIPPLWSVSGTIAFVLDTGDACGTADIDHLKKDIHITSDTAKATGGCYNGKQYYLVEVKGKAQECPADQFKCNDVFQAPPGLDTLDGSRFGGVTVTDLITGSVRSYVQNGNANGGSATDPTDGGSLDDLINQDVTTPGFIRIPVCSPATAYNAWFTVDSSVANWPCAVRPAKSECQTAGSSYVDQTSDGSPSVDDCMGIVNNIQGTQGEWEVENALGKQHQIVQFGKCKFGIQGLNKKGNVDFNLGAQDIVDIIKTAIQKFGGGGKIGAKGKMDCDGDLNSQDVEWGIY